MNQRSSKTVFLTALLCIAVLASIFSIISLANRSAKPQDKSNDPIAIRDALRRGGLREAAKLKGHYVREFSGHWGPVGIESLTKNSTAVIVGRVTKQLGTELVEDGQIIVTYYEVTIEETIKGAVNRGNTIRISLPGGRVEFEDGTSAEVITPTFEHVQKNGVYALFLSQSDDAPDSYALFAGPQGVVEFDSNSQVRSRGQSTDPVANETKGRSTESFLKVVREYARKWPGPGRCCS